ncbi:MAG: IS481 family transposase [Candidatus Krumholzibacteriia bacterium]
MNRKDEPSASKRWARLRFAIVGRLLASPPKQGDLGAELGELAKQFWKHPTTGERVQFGRSTIERWYYTAKRQARDPMGALGRKSRKDAGAARRVTEALLRALRLQHKEHPGWSYQLHHDNLQALAEQDETLRIPSYTTVRRTMKRLGLTKVRSRSRRRSETGERAARRLEKLEVRSFEASHVHGLWHLDFHPGSHRVITEGGEWKTPHLFGVLDDRSRLCCHLQWYLDETAETLVHGLSQAIQKRALPRSLMTDNGSAMLAEETVTGLDALSIVHETTLVESPYQNGKQEVFWGQVEGRLLAMLEGVKELTLDLLNDATQAWVELEYNRSFHEEIGCTPLERYLKGPEVGRESPGSEELRRAFRKSERRTQRRSDGTVSIEGKRYELPSRFRQQSRVLVCYARWDLSRIDIVDPRSGAVLSPIYPQDKERNADGRRRRLEPLPDLRPCESRPSSGEIAPLLKKLMREYAATGLPPAYLPKHEDAKESDQ